MPTSVALIHLLPREPSQRTSGLKYKAPPERGGALPDPEVVFDPPYPFPELAASGPLLTAIGVALLVAVVFSWRAARTRPEAALATALVLVSVAWPLAWKLHGYAVWPHIVLPLGAALALTLRGPRSRAIVQRDRELVSAIGAHVLVRRNTTWRLVIATRAWRAGVAFRA